MAFCDLGDSGYQLRKGPHKILEASFLVHQTKKSDGTANPPFTCLHVKWQPLTDDLKTDDGEPKDRYYSLTFKRNTDFFLPSEDDQTAAGASVGASGKFWVAVKPSDQKAPDKQTEFGVLLGSLLNAGADVAKLNESGAAALAGLLVDVDTQVREGKPDEKGVKPTYHSDIVVKIHPQAAAQTTSKGASAGAPKGAAAGKKTETAAVAAVPAPASNGDFDGDSWLIEALTEVQGKFAGQTKPAAFVLAQVKMQAAKSPAAKDWVAKTAAANAEFWQGPLQDMGLGVVDGKSVTLS